MTGVASTVSTVSIVIKETLDYFDNNDTDTVEEVSSTVATSIELLPDPGNEDKS